MTISSEIQSSNHSSEGSTVVLPLFGLHCGSCVRKIEDVLKPFADGVQVSLEPMQVKLIGLQANATLEIMQSAVASSGNYSLDAAEPSTQAKNPSVAQPQSFTMSDPTWLSWFKTYRPLLLIVTFILGSSVLVQLGQSDASIPAISGAETMRYFMAGFFLVFAFFKLLDLRAFANAYAGYDLLAARWRGWGFVYPFVELLLGAAYLANFQPTVTALVTLVVMGFSAIGVILAVARKSNIQCACLGTVFQLPMSTVTIVEDVGMVFMALLMLVWM